MNENHKFFPMYLLRILFVGCLFIAFELITTRFLYFGPATAVAGLGAALIGLGLSRRLLPLGDPSRPAVAPGPALAKDNHAPVNAPRHAPPRAPDPMLEQLSAEVARLRQQLDRLEQENQHLKQAQHQLEQQPEEADPFPDELVQLGYHGAVEDFKRRLLAHTITLSQGNRAAAARQLGLQRTYLYRLVKQLQVKA